MKLAHFAMALALTGCVSAPEPLETPITEYTRQGSWDDWEGEMATFNIWGLPLIGKSVKERMPRIGSELKARSLDFALIQEGWMPKDRKTLSKYSGLAQGTYFSVPRSIGSGLFNMSSGEQLRSSFREFTLNGHLKDVAEADAYAGKGVAMTTVDVRGLPVSIFNTHAIARYGVDGDEVEDDHTLDRMLQMFEIFRHIVEQTDSDAFMVAGDFNMRHFHTEYKFWRALTSLDGIREEEKDPAACTYCPSNTFHDFNEGQLDYVFISPRLAMANYKRDFDVPFKAKNGAKMSLSDHYGWSARLITNPGASPVTPEAARESGLRAIRQLKARLEGHQRFLDGLLETKGVEDRICRKCRVADGIKGLMLYEKALLAPLQGEDDPIAHVRQRLESYFGLFE